MRYFHLVLALAISILTAVPSAGQDRKPTHRIYTDKEGLELDRINTMVFDNDGFLWLGGRDNDIRKIIQTDKRLSIQRFNGNTFHNFPIPETNSTMVSVDHFFKRSDGKLYIKAVSDKPELFLFDPVSTAFEEIEIALDNVDAVAVSRVFEHKDTNYLLLQYDRRVHLSVIHDDLSIKSLFSFTSNENKFMVDHSTEFIPFEEFIVIGDDNFPVTIFDWEGNILKRFAPETFTRERGRSVDKFWIQKVLRYKDIPLLIMNGENRLYTIDSLQKEIIPWKDIGDDVIDSDNIVRDVLGGQRITRISPKEELKIGRVDDSGINWMYELPGFSINSAVQLLSSDLSLDLWIGTSTNELHYVEFPSEKIQNYLTDYSIRVIHQRSNGDYIVATETDGWFILDPKNKALEPFDLSESGTVLFPVSARNIIDAGDYYWSNSGGNILKIQKDSGKTQAFRHYPVTCLERMTDSTLIYGTNGYYLMEFNTNTYKHRQLLQMDTLFTYDLEVFPERNLILASTDKGALKYNSSSGDAQLLRAENGLKDPFLLMSEYDDNTGLLFGSRSGHLYKYDLEDDSLDLIYEDKLQAGIATVLFDENRWWINTFDGLVVFDPETRIEQRFSVKEGLSHNEANRYSALQTEDGIFLGSLSGLNYFKPEDLKIIDSDSRLELLLLRSYDREAEKVINRYNRDQITAMDKIVLPAEVKELQIDFALTNNAGGRPHRFKYRFNGDQWIDLGQQQTLRFPNLAVGSYDLELIAEDFSGNQLGETISLNLESKDFFYNTWQFFLLISLLAVLLLLYLNHQTGLRRRMQQQFSDALLISQEEERNRIAKDLHDSVGQQLTLIKKKAQTDNQKELSDLTHNALEEVRAISRGLYPAVLKQIGLSSALEQLVNDLDEQTQIFFSTEIDNIDDVFDQEKSLNMYRLVQEVLNNIIKHSNASTVYIGIKNENRNLNLRIEDNGVGYDIQQKNIQNSLGLKTISERIRILGGMPEIKSVPGQGTTVQASIRLKQ